MTYYYTLMTSLPRHSRQFKVKQTPISRIQLEKRLKLLTAAERTVLNNLIDVVWNSWFSPHSSISETIAKAKPLFALHNDFIDAIIYWFFDVRSLFVALRLRKIQQSLPSNPQDYWHTRWSLRLIANWNQPDFGLKYIYPWLANILIKMKNAETDEVEDLLLSQIWKHFNTIETGHVFDFEALIIYVLRWNVVNYWSQFNETTARERIITLSLQTLADKQKIKERIL